MTTTGPGAVLANPNDPAAGTDRAKDRAEATSDSSKRMQSAPEPKKPPTPGNKQAKAITVTSRCGDYMALSVRNRDAAAFYVTKEADTNQAGFPQWRALIDDWCKRSSREEDADPKLSEFLEPFKKSNNAKPSTKPE